MVSFTDGGSNQSKEEKRERKVAFGTASDPIHPKIRRHNAITRTANNLIAPALISTSKKTLEQNLKRTGDFILEK
ncbi:hypothetical protein SADUNF_Sadunf18G0104600 [Salix dunnii]|uniref:Uncharacterized protein n=1 Tax=Salix dunnii TaxID=1413687 RepID=A0A835J503_9ROSI|nr:hypothetical protein SADUNF_Sadunf18G0104600 [Salix dunnii]